MDSFLIPSVTCESIFQDRVQRKIDFLLRRLSCLEILHAVMHVTKNYLSYLSNYKIYSNVALFSFYQPIYTYHTCENCVVYVYVCKELPLSKSLRIKYRKPCKERRMKSRAMRGCVYAVIYLYVQTDIDSCDSRHRCVFQC